MRNAVRFERREAVFDSGENVLRRERVEQLDVHPVLLLQKRGEFLLTHGSSAPAEQELQSLCLDIRVLDENGDEIELRDEDEDEVVYTTGIADETYITDEGEVMDSGFALDEDQPDDGVLDILSELVSNSGDDYDEEM